MRALVIDDSRAIRTILTSMLKKLGFEVVEAANGKEGIERLRQGAIDVATVDWNMPEMNGYEFVTAVRSDRIFDATRLVMVTTETEMNQVARAIEAGANEYVMKPFTRDIIEDKFRILGLVPEGVHE